VSHPFDERGAELRQVFFESAQELLQSLNEDALKLEKKPDDGETIRSIRRGVHTLKGDAAATGFRELSELAHELEDALVPELASSHAAVASIAFFAADLFAAMLAAYRNDSPLPSSAGLRKMVRELSAKVADVTSQANKKAKSGSEGAVWTEYENLAVRNALAQNKNVYHVTAMVDAHCAMPIAARQMLLNVMAGLGDILGTRPDDSSPRAATTFEVLLATAELPEVVISKSRIPTIIANVNVETLQGPAELASDANSGASSRSASQAAKAQAVETATQPATVASESLLRVGADRIDAVLNLVGELIIGKSMLQQVQNEFARRFPKDNLRGRFADAMAFQGRVLNDLQRSVMKIRMVPVGQLFRRFPRMVRDLAKQCGREVEIVVSGEDTDLDKSILDAIAEPLTHLVRNAVSHGIENAGERASQGKPPHGTLRLNAYHHGNQVIVEISDDGRGIDAHNIKTKAIARGLLQPDEAARLSDAEALQYVFRPGFSTAEEITEISGRGVGLDVVQSVMHRLKGRVDIETVPGTGTTFRLKLPLTLAIIKALLFRVDRRLYAIALNAVAEISRSSEADIHKVDNHEILQLRNQVLPLVRLGSTPDENSPRAATKIFILMIQVGERRLGLIVDALEGEEELVIKALDDQTIATDLISGASILGDGRVVLILNIPAIVERHANSRPQEVAAGLLLAHSGQGQFSAETEVRQ